MVKIATIEEITQVIDNLLEEKMIRFAAQANGSELGRIIGKEEAAEMVGMSVSHIMKLASKRYSPEGIPCVNGRKNQLAFSTVALQLWQMGKDCAELTAWLEEKLKV